MYIYLLDKSERGGIGTETQLRHRALNTTSRRCKKLQRASNHKNNIRAQEMMIMAIVMQKI